MSYSMAELLLSVISAAVYGIIFAVISNLAWSILKQIKALLMLPREMFFYKGNIFSFNALDEDASLITEMHPDKVFPKDRNRNSNSFLQNKAKMIIFKIFSNVREFFKVILFFLGIVLTSYYSLDGAFRIYFLLISVLISCVISRLLLNVTVLIDKMCFGVYKGIIILFRTVTFPLRFVIFKLYGFLRKIMDKITRFIFDRISVILDKRIN